MLLAHEPDCTGGRIEERLAQRGVEVHTHVVTEHADRPNDARPFPVPAAGDLLVVMGSVRSLTRKHDIDTWIHDEIALVRDAHHRGVPVLGICFGGQLLADALGGSVEVAPVTELGWVELLDGDAPNPLGPGPWFEWHHDRFTAPPGSRLLARSEHAEQLFRIGRSVGTQFHPEVDVAHVERWLSAAADEELTRSGTTRHDVVAAVREHEAANVTRCHRLVDWFLDDVAEVATPTRADNVAVPT